jgi:Chromo (CHRromatin Organisation MOdifier) domain
MPPLELALTRPPKTTSLQDLPRDEELDPKREKQAILERLKTLRLRADGRLSSSQARYKSAYDRGVTTKNNAQLREGDQAYVRVEFTEVGQSHKLDSLVHEPYRIVKNAGHTFRLQVGLDIIRVSSDRVTPAPPASVNTNHKENALPEMCTKNTSSGDACVEVTPPKGKKTEQGNGNGEIASAKPPPEAPIRKTVRWAPDVVVRARTREEYAIEPLYDSGYGGDGAILYRVRWEGYSPEEDTWESAQHLPPHVVRRFEKTKKSKNRGALLIEELSRAGVGPWF